MKIKIGDQVRFLNDVGEGVVKKILDKQMVEVETLDGWSIPYLISELIVIPDNPDTQPFRPESNPVVFHETADPKKGLSAVAALPQVALLAVRDVDKQAEFIGIRWYLVNDSDFTLAFSFYQENESGEIKMIESDHLEPGTKIFIQELAIAELSKCKGFHVQGLLTRPSSDSLPPLVSGYVPFQVKKFSTAGAYMENDYLHEDVLAFDVIHKLPSDTPPISMKDADIPAQDGVFSKPGGKTPVETVSTVDLHINQLVESVVGLSNREIIKIQMAVFERELNQAIEQRKREIIFIHGIGNGTLKETLRKTISNDYPICSFEDASFREYGFGATLVQIRQNR